MLALLVFLVVMLFVFGAIARASGRRRRAALEEEERRQDGSFPVSPLDLLFGGMLGGGVRSYELDPETGRWVEVTNAPPQREPDEPPPHADTPAGDRRRRRAERLRQRPAQ